MSWTVYVTNEEVLWRIRTTRKLLLTIRQLKCLAHIIMRKGLENKGTLKATETQRELLEGMDGNPKSTKQK